MRLPALFVLPLATFALAACAGADASEAADGSGAMTTGSAYGSPLALGTYTAPAVDDGDGAFLWIHQEGTRQVASLDMGGVPRCQGDVDVPRFTGGTPTVVDQEHSCELTLEPKTGSVHVTLAPHGGAKETFDVVALDLGKLKGSWEETYLVGGNDLFVVEQVSERKLRAGRDGRFHALSDHPRTSASVYGDVLKPYGLLNAKGGRLGIRSGQATYFFKGR
jgi:hypothetical protein